MRKLWGKCEIELAKIFGRKTVLRNRRMGGVMAGYYWRGHFYSVIELRPPG